MAELKPCPFCGGVASKFLRLPFHGEQIKYGISCADCNAQTAMAADIEEAIEAWNRRADNESR